MYYTTPAIVYFETTKTHGIVMKSTFLQKALLASTLASTVIFAASVQAQRGAPVVDLSASQSPKTAVQPSAAAGDSYYQSQMLQDEVRELRGMGEANAVAARSRAGLRRDTLFAAAARYQELYADDDGRIPATFQIIWMTGWAPHETQQQPLRPGSGTTRLADALDAEEQATGDKASPKR